MFNGRIFRLHVAKVNAEKGRKKRKPGMVTNSGQKESKKKGL